jgi:hypothetical protein
MAAILTRFPVGVTLSAMFRIACVTFSLALCVSTRAAEPARYAFQPNTPAPGQGVIRVTGVGLSGRAAAPGQARLMAERAAVLDAYRNLALALGQGSQMVTEGRRYITASGYVVGAEIVQTRYYPGGRVEVDMTLPVRHPPSAPPIEPPPRPGEPPQLVEKQKREISEDEWLKLYKEPQPKTLPGKEKI